jgi:hypothetical protein
VSGEIEEAQEDEAGYRIRYRPSNRPGERLDRYAKRTGGRLWTALGPPLASIDDSLQFATLPSGTKVAVEGQRISSVAAFDQGFFVTTFDANVTGLEWTPESRRNVRYFSADGTCLWRIQDPPGAHGAIHYDGIDIRLDGSIWAHASGASFMGRIDPATGVIVEVQPDK